MYNNGIWKDSVEKYSFRYVSNNGCYRALKAQMVHTKPTTVHRKHSPTTGLTLSHEQKALRRDISKDLRIQFQTLLEHNHSHFQAPKSTSIVCDYLEDEEDYKENQTKKHKLPSGTTAPITNQLLVIDPELKSRNFTEINTQKFPEANPERILETQSAHPPPIAGRLENLMINKRCSTNMDKYSPLELEGVHAAPPDNGWIKADKPHSKSLPVMMPPFHGVQVTSTMEVEALAKRTFNNPKGTGESSRAPRALGPIEKVTPSLREMYDNSKAAQELLKLNKFRPVQPVDMNVSSFSSLKPRAEIGNTKFATKSTASVGPGTTANFRSAKYGDLQTKSSRLGEIINVDVDNPNSTFQAFLPCISGKRITSKVSSLR
ncbi:uncharacterized protein [Watersipora subatra]|uniref:uncharacterized protein n=1 Tax=Watersipora subatra TaxID=2589382 RepID=UPI00355C5C92